MTTEMGSFGKCHNIFGTLCRRCEALWAHKSVVTIGLSFGLHQIRSNARKWDLGFRCLIRFAEGELGSNCEGEILLATVVY